MHLIYTLHGPRPNFDPKDETPTETPEAKGEREFQERAAKLAKEHGLTEKGTKVEEEKKEEKPEEDEKETEADDEKEDSEAEEELKEEQLTQAKLIYKLLNNPNTALQALDTLARTAGYSLKELKEATKEEKKEISKSIKETVEEKLGTKIPFLSKELGETLQEVIDKAIKDGTKDLREKIEAESNTRRESEMKASFEKVVSSYDGISEAILKEIVRIQDSKEILPGTMESEKYFKTCVILAADNLGVVITKKSAATSTTKNKEKASPDALSRLGGNKNQTHKEGVRAAQITTMKDAIEAAAAKLDATFAEK